MFSHLRRSLQRLRPIALATAGLLLVAASASAQTGPRGPGGDGTDLDGFRGWYIGADFIRSMEQGPFGTQWGDASRAIGARIEAPAIRNVRPTLDATTVTVRGDCRTANPCPQIDGWTVRAGLTLGDLPSGDDFIAAPYLRGDLGVHSADGDTSFSPSLRAGLLVRATERLHPRIEAGQTRYPTTRRIWEVSAGLRVALF